MNSNRDLLFLSRHEFMSQGTIEQQVEQLNKILLTAENFEEFRKAHELVQRNHIHSKSKILLKTFKQAELKPFWFLLNKN